jgi:HAD superfamily hydrolase (TIGR01490 family)
MARLRDDMARMITGWDVQLVRDIVDETLHELIDPLVYDEAVGLIKSHHDAGRDVVIVSSSGEEVVGPIGKLLGADHVIATRMAIRDGRYTGDVDYYAAGATKAEGMRALAAVNGYDLPASYAYTDSITDLTMLGAVGHPHAVNPDRALRREAQLRGWPILDFRHPVPLRTRFTALAPTSRPIAAGITGVAAIAGVTVAWRRWSRNGSRHTGSPHTRSPVGRTDRG